MGSLAKSALTSVGVIIGLGTLFTVLGVYDTESVPFLKRLVFWTSTMFVGGAASVFVIPRFQEGALGEWPLAVRIPAAAAIIAVPVTLLVAAFSGGYGANFRLWVIQFGYVFLISLMITAGFWTAGHLAEQANAASDSGRDDGEASLFRARLPLKLRHARLIAVTSEDHYLRVHTDAGDDLILHRLSDALRELEGAGGLQTHRSWWVAKDAVRDVKRDNGRELLILENGLEAPVSRSFAAAVREAGLI